MELFLCVFILFQEGDGTSALDTVGLDLSSKQRESLLDIQWHVVPVLVDTCDLDLFSWFGDVNVVS